MKKTSIVFTGDIGFDRYMEKKWEDEQLLAPEILSFFHSADHVVANVEGALVRDAKDEGGKGIYFHTMNPDACKMLKRMRADIFCLANNHTMDAGKAGMESTLAIAAQMGCKTVGAGLDVNGASAPVYLAEAGGIGMIAVAYRPACPAATETEAGCFGWSDMDRIAERIKQIKAKCRWCIMIVHGGEEFAAIPNPYTREKYREYIALGADIVVGHHPHVPENYEILEEGQKAIFYSLGNFIFDTDNQREHLYTDIGILLKLSFTEERFTFDAIGALLDRKTETIGEGELPPIFTDLAEDEYFRLLPIAVKAFIKEEHMRLKFLLPERFANATEADWKEYYKNPRGYVENEHFEFRVLLPLAEAAERGEWKKSGLPAVKDYILALLA